MKPRLQKTFFVILTAALVLVSSCAPKQTVLSKADTGKQVSVNVGGQLAVSLASNPSTGYTWETKNLDAAFLQQLGEAKFKSDNSALVGSGGTLTLTFKALKPGMTTLTLVYHQPWETNVDPIDTFSVTVTIR